MARKLSFILILCFCLFLAACNDPDADLTEPDTGGTDDTQETVESGETTTITWWDYATGLGSDALDELIADYEDQNPEVSINRTYVPFGELKNQLFMGSAADELPDIVIIDNPDHQAFSAAGVFADLTDEIEEWGEADYYFEGPWSSTLYEGRNYGIPRNSNNLALYYNEDMLEESGVDPPSDWDELREVAEALTQDGVYGFAVAGVGNEQSTFQFLPFVWQAGSDLDNLNSEGTHEALEFWDDLFSNGWMSPETLNWEQQDIRMQFTSENVAMMVNGTWEINNLEEEANFNWGVVTLPQHHQGGTILGGENWAISSESEHQDIAWDIIQFTQEEEQMKNFLVAAGGLPTRSDLIEDPHWQEDEHLKVFADGMEVAKARAYGPDYPEISLAIQEMIHGVLAGQVSLEDAIEKADQTIQPLLAKE